jgi:hypothetical protein
MDEQKRKKEREAVKRQIAENSLKKLVRKLLHKLITLHLGFIRPEFTVRKGNRNAFENRY